MGWNWMSFSLGTVCGGFFIYLFMKMNVDLLAKKAIEDREKDDPANFWKYGLPNPLDEEEDGDSYEKV